MRDDPFFHGNEQLWGKLPNFLWTEQIQRTNWRHKDMQELQEFNIFNMQEFNIFSLVQYFMR